MSKGARWRLDSAADLAGKPENIRRQLSPFLNERTTQHQARDPGPDSKLECDSGHAPVVPPQGPSVYTKRVRVRFVVYRKRLIDPCNECSKWMVDCLRYFRILKDDRLSDIALEVDQREARSEEEERTEIEIIPL